MAYLIGTDEAGYGPNLGPLVVSATVWHLPDEPPNARLADIDLYDRLQSVITQDAPAPETRTRDGTSVEEALRLVWIADSKHIYKPRGSLAPLEHGVLSALESCQDMPSTWPQVWRGLDPTALDQCRRAPWYQRATLRIPTEAGLATVKQSADRLRAVYHATNCQLLRVHSAAVFPARFNDLLDELGNKSTLLSRVTLGLVDRAMADLLVEPTLVLCDKHGGRNKYAPLLQAQFGEDFIQVRHESRAESVYWQGPAATRREFHFRAGGETFLPAALASMTSKYLRELSMKVFNRYWQRQVPGIKPTAGYPQDARRFRKDIRVAQRELEIADRVLWRER